MAQTRFLADDPGVYIADRRQQVSLNVARDLVTDITKRTRRQMILIGLKGEADAVGKEGEEHRQ